MTQPIRNRKKTTLPSIRAMLDYFMALIMLLAGCFIMFSEAMIGRDYFADSLMLQGGMKWVFGVLFIFYGFFRAYRGFISQKEEHNSHED